MKDSAFQSVCSALSTHLGFDPDSFRSGQHLAKDWGLDRLDLNVIALNLEQLEGIELSSAELACVQTVGHLVNLLRQRKQSFELESWMQQLDGALQGGSRARRGRRDSREARNRAWRAAARSAPYPRRFTRETF